MEKIKALIDLAFEAGKWAGQVELEEHYDREQYSAVMPEVFSSKKTNLPADLASPDRTVRVNLRSQVWRDGVKKTCAEKINKIKNMIEPTKREPVNGTLELTEEEMIEFSKMVISKKDKNRFKIDRVYLEISKVETVLNIDMSEKNMNGNWIEIGNAFIRDIPVIAWIAEKFEIK